MDVNNQSYIVTLDLGEKLEAFRRIAIDAPGPYDEYTRDIQTELVSTIQHALPGVKVEPVYMADLSDEVGGAAKLVGDMLNEPVIVSSCPEIAYPSRGVEIQVNRLIDSNGDPIGFGPRPGHDPIRSQIARAAKEIGDSKVIIVEDGIFTGGTIKYLINEFKKQKIDTAAVVAGFSCEGSDTSWFESNGYDLITARNYDGIIDWIPDHDFLPFVPGSGKVIGVAVNETAYPFYDYRQATYSVPYIQPFGPTEKWASLPAEKVRQVSAACIKMARDLFIDIEKRNSDKDIRIGDLLSTYQRSSVPLSLNSDNFPPLTSRVSKYLSECD